MSDTWKKGSKIWSRDAATQGELTGSRRQCQMEGCTGIRVATRWPDGKLTWPCTKGLLDHKDGFKIG